ncbi:MAG: hypothetical protein WAT71_01425 [Ignavibacteria bacterium]
MLRLFFSTAVIFFNLFCGFTFSNVYSTNLYQVTTLNNDRSGKIKLTYWDATSKLKDLENNTFLLFTEEKIRTIYASDNNTIDNITISKNNPETTYVNVFITFKDFLKINSAVGFSKVEPTWFVTPDSTTLLYKFDKNDEFAKLKSAIYKFELPTSEILRSSGLKEGSSFSVKVDSEEFAKGTTIFAVFKNSDKEVSSNQTNSSGNKDKESEIGNDNSESPKKCGVFSIELPVLILFGMFFRKRNLLKKS